MFLIIGYKASKSKIISKDEFQELRITDSTQELELLQQDYENKNLTVDVTENQRDINILQSANHFITGWDKDAKSFVVKSSESAIESYILKKKLNMVDMDYRTPRTLSEAIRGDTIALARLEEAEELCIPLREQLAKIEPDIDYI